MIVYKENPKESNKRQKKLLELMSPARLQDTSIHINQLYFYIPAINNPKKKNPIYNSIKKNNRNKCNKRNIEPTLRKPQNIVEGN